MAACSFSWTVSLLKRNTLPTTDRIGGLIQLKVGEMDQVETVSTLQMVAKDTAVEQD